ncbi:MAG: glycosyltransferase [Flavobacteriales bacterium]
MKELWLFTIRFPYGTLENSLEHEVPVLCRHFDKVVLFPLLREEVVRPLPANAEVRTVIDDPFRPASLWTMFRHWRLWYPMWRDVFGSAPSKEIRRRQRRGLVSKMRQAVARVLRFKQVMGPSYDPQRVVLYSSWTLDWATVLSLWKLMDPRVRFVTRMRGFDLYDHRAPDGWQAFQPFHLRHIEHLYTTSKASHGYLLARYPGMAGGTSISPTATDDHGQGPWSPSDVLRIVSCSNLIPIKRVHLIAEALAGMQQRVHWTHFGDGPEMARVMDIVRDFPPHIRADLKGRLPNAAIVDWYKQNPVDLFIHVSSTEGGVSVAVQEATSFGIPVLGADAGGVGEIVNDITGELLPLDLTSEYLRTRIEAFAARGCGADKRERIAAFWNERFNAEQVHETFARDLLTR